MPSITSANVANAIVKLVAADALPALVGNLVMGNLVNRDYEPVLAQAGDTVNIPIRRLMANNMAEGCTVTPQNPSLGNAQIVLNTHCEATFQIPDVTKRARGAGSVEGLHGPRGDRHRRKDRKRSDEPVCGFYGEHATRHCRYAGDRSDSRPGGNSLFRGQGTGQRTEVPDRRQQYLLGDAPDSAVQRISDCGEAGLRAIVDGTIGKIKDFFVFRSQYVQKTSNLATPPDLTLITWHS